MAFDIKNPWRIACLTILTLSVIPWIKLECQEEISRYCMEAVQSVCGFGTSQTSNGGLGLSYFIPYGYKYRLTKTHVINIANLEQHYSVINIAYS